MRYLVIHWIDEAALDRQSTAIESEVEAWTAEMDRRGARLQGEPLRRVIQAATVRIRGGDLLLSDGPFAETKEQIAGFDLIECASMAEAKDGARCGAGGGYDNARLHRDLEGVGLDGDTSMVTYA